MALNLDGIFDDDFNKPNKKEVNKRKENNNISVSKKSDVNNELENEVKKIDNNSKLSFDIDEIIGNNELNNNNDFIENTEKKDNDIKRDLENIFGQEKKESELNEVNNITQDNVIKQEQVERIKEVKNNVVELKQKTELNLGKVFGGILIVLLGIFVIFQQFNGNKTEGNKKIENKTETVIVDNTIKNESSIGKLDMENEIVRTEMKKILSEEQSVLKEKYLKISSLNDDNDLNKYVNNENVYFYSVNIVYDLPDWSKNTGFEGLNDFNNKVLVARNSNGEELSLKEFMAQSEEYKRATEIKFKMYQAKQGLGKYVSNPIRYVFILNSNNQGRIVTLGTFLKEYYYESLSDVESKALFSIIADYYNYSNIFQEKNIKEINKIIDKFISLNNKSESLNGLLRVLRDSNRM